MKMPSFTSIFKWLCLVIIKPSIYFWIIWNGIPPTVRAIGYAIKDVIKALDK